MRHHPELWAQAPRGTRRLGVLVAMASALLLSAVVAVQAATPKATKPPMIQLDYEKYTLPNGLDVILRRDARVPMVAVNVWYHVGPANETEGLTGFAHLFEHMMFQGSGHVADDAQFKLLEAAGASNINGTTDFDRTNYMEDLP
ncbi:MAG: insulinase family protein, partial [Candidatus Eisenbacteria bacterium]